jgi:NAD(P)-dependent dehydrogenase (short-subunit alcohol dehydrogenase family)
MRLAGKVTLITGGGAGFGRACVDLFAREGALVVIAERDIAAGESARDAVAALGLSCLFVPTDVSDPDSVSNAVSVTIQTHGRIDILYNNVRGSTMNDGPVTKPPFDEFWNKMKTDRFGIWLCCHYTIPHMIAHGGGSVINASSMYALVGTPGRDAYTAAKGAISALTRPMAVEFAQHKVRINAVAAAGTTTKRVRKPSKRIAFHRNWRTRTCLGSSIRSMWRTRFCLWPPMNRVRRPVTYWRWTAASRFPDCGKHVRFAQAISDGKLGILACVARIVIFNAHQNPRTLFKPGPSGP